MYLTELNIGDRFILDGAFLTVVTGEEPKKDNTEKFANIVWAYWEKLDITIGLWKYAEVKKI